MTKIFVSYSREDRRWVHVPKDAQAGHGERAFIPWLARQLGGLGVEIWADPDLADKPGVDFTKVIEDEINSSDFAILLVSQDFVSSEFICNVELPLIRNRVEAGEMQIIPILVADVVWDWNEEAQWLQSRQIIPGSPTPLLSYARDEAAWKKVRVEILGMIRNRVKRLQDAESPPDMKGAVAVESEAWQSSSAQKTPKSGNMPRRKPESEERIAGSRQGERLFSRSIFPTIQRVFDFVKERATEFRATLGPKLYRALGIAADRFQQAGRGTKSILMDKDGGAAPLVKNKISSISSSVGSQARNTGQIVTSSGLPRLLVIGLQSLALLAFCLLPFWSTYLIDSDITFLGSLVLVFFTLLALWIVLGPEEPGISQAAASEDSNPEGRRRDPPPTWIYSVFASYMVLWIAIGILLLVGLVSEMGSSDAGSMLIFILIFCLVFIMPCVILIRTPVKQTRRRGVGKTRIWPAFVAALILFTILCLGIIAASAELLLDSPGNSEGLSLGNIAFFIILGAIVVIWFGWLLFFRELSQITDASGFTWTAYNVLLGGSALEVLIAVPTHLIVRRRDECCAGVTTGLAICLGVMVAFIAFGPGLSFLYIRRWKTNYALNPNEETMDAGLSSGPGAA